MQAAQLLFRKAVEWLEDEGKDMLAGDVFRCAHAPASLPARQAGDASRQRSKPSPRAWPRRGFYRVSPSRLRQWCILAMPTWGNLSQAGATVCPRRRPCRRQAVAQLVRCEKWADAVSMLLRFAASCDGMGARNSQCKAYLGAVVVWLYAGKAKDAWVTYQASAAGCPGQRGSGGGAAVHRARRLHVGSTSQLSCHGLGVPMPPPYLLLT